MFDGFSSSLLSYHVGPIGIDGNAGYCLNDQPLPSPVGATFPPVVGTHWLAGSQIIFTFGDLAPEDYARIAALVTGTLTVPFVTTWLRPKGTFVFAPPTLTFTLTSDLLLDPHNITDPFI